MVEMKGILLGLIFGITIGWIVGAVFVLYSVFFCSKNQIEKRNSPITSRGVDSTTAFSDSNVGQESPRTSEWSSLPQWLEGLKRKNVVSACGIPKCSYKYVTRSSALTIILSFVFVLHLGFLVTFSRDIQKATRDFTTSIGEGHLALFTRHRWPLVRRLLLKFLPQILGKGRMIS
jgi:hypothetical protein